MDAENGIDWCPHPAFSRVASTGHTSQFDKIISASVAFRDQAGIDIRLDRLYPAVVFKVVIYELAHRLMDDRPDRGDEHAR